MTRSEKSANAPQPIQRPNGVWFRPRQLRVEECDDGGTVTDIVVFGTHDVELAQPLAVAKLTQLIEDQYVDRGRALETERAECVWWQRTLVGFEYDVAEYSYRVSPDHGASGVRFPLTWPMPPDALIADAEVVAAG